MHFEAFTNDIIKNEWNVFGVEVYEHGKLIHEYGDTVKSKFPIYSATKTIISIATGIACDEGKFNIEKPILDYLPVKTVEQMSQEQISIFKNITIQR